MRCYFRGAVCAVHAAWRVRGREAGTLSTPILFNVRTTRDLEFVGRDSEEPGRRDIGHLM